jgi:uncharacterized protein (DUF302 family)
MSSPAGAARSRLTRVRGTLGDRERDRTIHHQESHSMTDPARTMQPSIGKTVDTPFDEALASTEAALKEQGFGVLTRIDVKATLKEKLDVDHPPYQILGACMPPMAHKALTAVPEIGIMLPCNVVVRQVEGGKTRVEVVNTEPMAQMFPSPVLAEVAKTVGERLERVLDAV